ncbi:MAG: tetratricopeptide repeat protein [Clostridium sp.]|nr:tetratricopeptide repeat protein [Clostridium sp.]MCM1208712.1 tetratricopeptide repeat protein [Ruminococcus sp.]
MNKQRRKKQLERRSQIIVRTTFAVVIALMLGISIPHLFTKKYSYRDKGVACYHNASYAQAIEYFDDALSCKQWFSKEADIDILMYKADCHIRLNQFHDAYDAYGRILTDYNDRYYNRDSIKFLQNLSLCLESYANGNYGSNAAVFAQAVDKGYTEMSLYAANCYEKNGDYENMIQYYDIYTSIYGTSGKIAYKYAAYYMQIEDYNKALSYIEAHLDISDEYTDDLLYLRIMSYSKLQNYEKAFSLAEEYIGKYPNDAAGRELYDFLYTRVNVDTEVVHDIYNLN